MPPKKKAVKKSTTKKATTPILQIHGNGKIAKIKQDENCEASIRDFVVDKLKIGSFQLFTQPDDSGEQVKLSTITSFTGTHLYVKERNKAQS